ncbi:MAG: CreA family protein [Parvibaculaceae bacterium]|nr:CreA family protein [Parvibaculaceae bacterium]
MTLVRFVPFAAAAFMAALALAPSPAKADDLDCVSTTFRFVGANDKVCVSAFDDPRVPGVTCYIAQARTGGISGSFGLAEDPSRFSLSCRQTGPISTNVADLKNRQEVYSEKTSVFFKNTHVYRLVDAKRNTLVYLAISNKIIDGSPESAIASVPVMAWPAP